MHREEQTGTQENTRADSKAEAKAPTETWPVLASTVPKQMGLYLEDYSQLVLRSCRLKQVAPVLQAMLLHSPLFLRWVLITECSVYNSNHSAPNKKKSIKGWLDEWIN